MATSLTTLDPPQAIEPLDFEAALADLIAYFTAHYPGFTAALESDPVIKLLETAAYREVASVRARINDVVRALLLAFATGADLEHLAAFYEVVKLPGETDDALRERVALALGAIKVNFRGTDY